MRESDNTSNLIIKDKLDHDLEVNLDKFHNNPENINSQISLAKSLYNARSRYVEANQNCLKIISNILESESNDEANLLLSKILIDEGRIEEAEKKIRSILITNPMNSDARLNLVKLKIEIGSFDEALNEIQKLLDKDDDTQIEAYSLLSKIATFNDEESPYISKMEALLTQELSNANRSKILYALAKAYLDLSLHEKSLTYFIEAGKVKDQHNNYCLEKTENLINLFKNSFNKNLTNQKIESNSKLNKNEVTPVFIVRFPGSSVNELEEIIYTSNRVELLGEAPFLNQMLAICDFDEGYKEFIEKFQKQSAEDISIFREYYIHNSQKNSLANLTLDSNKLNFLYVGLIKFLFPNAKILFQNSNKIESIFESLKENIDEGTIKYANSLDNINCFYCLFQDLMKYWLETFPNDILEVEKSELNSVETQDKISSFLRIDLNTNLKQEINSADKQILKLLAKKINI